MKRRKFITTAVFLLGIQMLFGQAKRDPRMVSMGGAYTTLADGIYAVGVNPANLSFQHGKPFMLQLGTLNFGFVNDYLSLENYTGLSGIFINEEKKQEIYDEIGDALRFTTDVHIGLPVLNYTSGNMAFTSDMIVVGDIGLPVDMFYLMLNGNPLDRPLDLTLQYEVMGLAEYGFSFAVPYEKFSWGITLKYLQGLFYLGIDPDSSFSNIYTDTDVVAYYGSGRYYIRQGIGGNGYGVDLGFTTYEFDGWKVGISLINALGTIYWNRPSGVKDILGVDKNSGLFKWGGQEVGYGQAMVYDFTIDSVNGLGLFNDSFEENFNSSKSVVKDTITGGDPRPFTIRYPSLFRFGVQKQVDPDFLLVSDLVAGFQDRLFVQRKWKWSIGVKFTRFPGFPLRLGYSWGGKDFKQLGLGFGIHKGPVMFDFALAFRNGIWLHSVKGLALSFGVSFTGFKGRDVGEDEPGGGLFPDEEE